MVFVLIRADRDIKDIKMSTLSRVALYAMIAVGTALPATQAIAAGKPTASQKQALQKNEFPIVVAACNTTMNGTLFNMTFKTRFDPTYFANRKFSTEELEILKQSFAKNFATALERTELSGYSMDRILSDEPEALAELNNQLAGYAEYLRGLEIAVPAA